MVVGGAPVLRVIFVSLRNKHLSCGMPMMKIGTDRKLRTFVSWQRLNLSSLNASTPAEFQRGWRVNGDIAEIVTRSVRIFLVSVHTAPPAAMVRAVR